MQQAAAAILIGWIVTQVAIIGFVSLLQPIVFCWGIWTLSLSRRVGSRDAGTVDQGRPAVGARGGPASDPP